MNGYMTVPKTFFWANGHAISAAYWADGEPNNYLGNDTIVKEGCLQFNHYNFKLNDNDCSSLKNVYCKYSKAT